MAYDLEDQNGPENRANAGGLGMNLQVSHVSNFLAIAVPGAYAAPGDEVKITTDHTFTSPAGFTKLRFVPDTHGINATIPEARDASGYNGTIEGDLVGEDEEITAEVLRNFCTGDVIVLAPTANGKYVQLGTEDFPAQIRQMDDTSGTSSEGQNKQRVAVRFAQPKKLFYSGVITPKS